MKPDCVFTFAARAEAAQHPLEDKQLARIVKRCRDLPGQELFRYIAEDGVTRSIGSADVNEYLQSITGEDYTAKDFRTWAGTVLAALALQELSRFESSTQAKRNLLQAVEHVAERLGNTPTICRKCYIHPAVIDSYLEGSMRTTLKRRAENALSEDLRALRTQEAAVLGLLQQRLQRGGLTIDRSRRPLCCAQTGRFARLPYRAMKRVWFARWSAIYHFHITRSPAGLAYGSTRVLFITTGSAFLGACVFHKRHLFLEERVEASLILRFGLPLRYHFRSHLHETSMPKPSLLRQTNQGDQV